MDNLAVYDVNNYLYANISSLLGTSTLLPIPIIPIQDQPETNDLGGPGTYLVYSIRTSVDPLQWWVLTDDVVYMIWNTDLNKISPVVNAMLNLFRRMDDSAQDINIYLNSINHNDYDFKTFQVLNTSMSNPTPDENGRYGQPFNIRYSYTINSATGYN